MIESILVDNFNTKIKDYFNSPDWEHRIRKKIEQIAHDEPWLTLIACYSIFGNQNKMNASRLKAINNILNSAGLSNRLNLSSISRLKVEEKLPEIKEYRKYINKILDKENFHFYPDRINMINKKLSKKNQSFEGNTNLDLLIEGISNNEKTTIFIEAKFLSDISYQVKYNPVRDQIIRNIDCGIDYVKDKNYADKFNNFYFILLTPKVFRTNLFGGNNKNELSKLGANSSRLYCYKMDEYKNPNTLKNLLPHRKLEDEDWKTISNNIGWITFEDFCNNYKQNSTIDDKEEELLIDTFFKERNLK